MQFQVPQFIDTEDKIVGPLTLKQFGFVAAGGILSAILYFTVLLWLWVIGSIIIFGAAIALAFVKIEGRPFINVLISAFNFYWRPQTYIWQAEKPVVARVPAREINAGMGAGGRSALEDILARSAAKIVHTPTRTRAAQIFSPKPAQQQSEPQQQSAQTQPAAAQPEAKAATQPETRPETQPKIAEPQVAARPRVIVAQPQPALISRATASIGSALHKSWEDLQTGAPFAQKTSDKQFLDKKMAERYQIFQRVAGDRHAAKRIDYR